MRTGLRLLVALVLLWLGLTFAILRPAAGQMPALAGHVILFWVSFAVEGTPSEDRIRRRWEEDCLYFGGVGADLEVRWIPAIHPAINGGQPVPAMQGVCTVPAGDPA